ncbi:MAG: hypothetical protein CAF45_006425 [Nitrospira sp. CG24E]|nr:MAG: hypothetical protein CAF45_006425 [Nitrospira sp. CG24E]
MIADAHTEEKMKNLKRGHQMNGQSRLCVRAGIMLLAVTVLSVTAIGVTQADDQPAPTVAVGYQNGTITAIHEKTLDIDGRTYAVVPDVVMLDQHGEAIEPGRLIVSAEVKFHVKKEQSNMIDQMIVTLPF